MSKKKKQKKVKSEDVSQIGFIQGYAKMWSFIKKYVWFTVLGVILTVPVGTLDALIALFLKPFMDDVMVSKQEEFASNVPLVIIGFVIIVAFITLCFSIRVFTYYFYYTRMQLADYFNQQVQFINMHKSEVNKNSNLTAVEKKDIIEAQKKWADVFTDISEMIVDDDIKSAKKVKTEINNSNKDLNPSNNIDVPNTGLDFF